MKELSTTKKTIAGAILFFVIMFIFTSTKTWDHKKTQSSDYNPEYNEKHKVIDTVIPLYENATPILIRDGFNIGGHAVIGSMDGGGRNIFIHDIPNCKPCKKFLLSL